MARGRKRLFQKHVCVQVLPPPVVFSQVVVQDLPRCAITSAAPAQIIAMVANAKNKTFMASLPSCAALPGVPENNPSVKAEGCKHSSFAATRQRREGKE
jgi:hypothetical protein